MAGAAGASDGVEAWARLADSSAAPLLDALRGIDAAPAAGVIERLRKGFAADTVTAAIELSIARTRARDKFGARADTLWCDRPGVEMASSPATAAWKAARFREAGAARIDDLCCGIGGDLMELARVAESVGVDMQPLRNPWVPQRKVRTRLDSMVANGHPCAWARTRDSATESKPPNGALGRAW